VTQTARRRQHHVATLQWMVAPDVDEAHVSLGAFGRRRGCACDGGIDVVLVDLDALGCEAVGHHDVAQSHRRNEDLVDAGQHDPEPGGPVAAPVSGAGARADAGSGVERARPQLAIDEEKAGAPPPEVVHRDDRRDPAGAGLGEKVGP
jgi:hypothetical protein